MNPTRILRSLALLVAAFVCCRGVLAQASTTIDLRSSITLPAGSPVLLKQIATVAGPDADRLATVVVLHADQAKAVADGVQAVTREAVRTTLTNADANWARTLLRGGTVTITFTAGPPGNAAGTQAAGAPAAPAAPAPPTTTTPPTDPRSLRAMLVRSLADAAGLEAGVDTVTLRTDSLSTADLQLLAAPVPPSWKCRIQVLGATPTGRTSIKIEAFEGDRVALSRTMNVEALVLREVLVVAAAGGISRDQVISAADLRTETRSLPVTESARLANVTADQAIGTAAKRRIDLGKPILPTDLATAKTAIVVKRGDDVWVSCIAGGMVLKTKAKSLMLARDGEIVQLQLEGSKKVISARMNGPGKAVIALDGNQADQPN